MTDADTCQRPGCDRPALRGGYLCAPHFEQVRDETGAHDELEEGE